MLNKVLGAADLDLTSFGLSFTDTLSSSAGKINRKYRVYGQEDVSRSKCGRGDNGKKQDARQRVALNSEADHKIGQNYHTPTGY